MAATAEPYLSDLAALVKKWLDADAKVGVLECRHFFSGAAAYRSGEIVASLTPAGLAFKVRGEIHDELLRRRLATPLRYFAAGAIKRDYVCFSDSQAVTPTDAARLLLGESLAT